MKHGVTYVDMHSIEDIEKLNVPNVYVASLNANIDSHYIENILNSNDYLFIPRFCELNDISAMFGIRGSQYCKEYALMNRVKDKDYYFTSLEYVSVMMANSLGNDDLVIKVVNGAITLNNGSEVKGFMRALNSSENIVLEDKIIKVDNIYLDEIKLRNFKVDNTLIYYLVKCYNFLDSKLRIKKKKERIYKGYTGK